MPKSKIKNSRKSNTSKTGISKVSGIKRTSCKSCNNNIKDPICDLINEIENVGMPEDENIEELEEKEDQIQVLVKKKHPTWEDQGFEVQEALYNNQDPFFEKIRKDCGSGNKSKKARKK